MKVSNLTFEGKGCYFGSIADVDRRTGPWPGSGKQEVSSVNDTPQHNELPLADYDHIPSGTLPSRISGLDQGGIEQLLSYERAHGNRLPVVQILEHRLDALKNGAEPSGTTSPSTPEVSRTSTGSPVSPATSGPPINPPSQGVPTNPAQPR